MSDNEDYDASDVDWRATAETLQAEVKRLHIATKAEPLTIDRDLPGDAERMELAASLIERREPFDEFAVARLLRVASFALSAQEAATEVEIERRLTYQYGVNPERRRVGFASFDELAQRVRRETYGPVNVVKKEARVVTFGPWQEVPADGK